MVYLMLEDPGRSTFSLQNNSFPLQVETGHFHLVRALYISRDLWQTEATFFFLLFTLDFQYNRIYEHLAAFLLLVFFGRGGIINKKALAKPYLRRCQTHPLGFIHRI